MITFSDGFEEAPRARQELVARVEPLVRKYMGILDAQTQPVIVVKDNIGSRWLGRTVWSFATPKMTRIELQRRVFDDDKTLERVLAHEMIHHSDFTSLTDQQIALMRMRLFSSPGHGRSFTAKAEQINEIMGEDYVTETSDQTYTLATETSKMFYLVVAPTPMREGYYGYAWAVRLTPDIGACAQHFVARRDGVLVASRDPRWTRGAKLGKTCRGLSIPLDAEDQAELARLYQTRSSV